MLGRVRPTLRATLPVLPLCPTPSFHSRYQVGFSYSDTAGLDHDEAGVAKDAVSFLQAFFKAHPSLQKLPFFVTGESYGGHYAPAISYGVQQNNKNPGAGDVQINLKGVAVGNGLTVPLDQYPYYPILAYNYSIEKLGKPVISLDTYTTMVEELKTCLPMIAECQTTTSECANAQGTCNQAQIGPYEETGLNPYDIREPCEFPPLCYDMSHITAFFNDATIQKALGVDPKTTWATCNYDVNGMFANDWMKQFGDPEISSQLESGTKVLIYAGDVDFICNWLGNQAWTLNLDWSGKAAFNAAPVTNWTVGGDVAGELRTSGGFSFLRVFDAGHMVPADKPAAALALLNELIHS